MIKKIIYILITLILLTGLALSSLWYFGYITVFRSVKPREVVMDMDYEQKLNPQAENTFFKDSLSIRLPADTIYSRFARKYKYESVDFEKAEKEFSNPIKMSDFVLKRGKNTFEAYCFYCHGLKGKGDGPIITEVPKRPNQEPFPGPPDLTRKETKAKSDARLYHILSSGQNLMFPVADKLSEEDRWILVLYIRHLQGL
jgi:mono/diheme cytochrome c family protein